MKKTILLVALLTIGLNFSAQETLAPDQNPNYQKSLDKFQESMNDYSVLQGTTKQQTYRSIDPLRDKRERKELRKQHRANRPLWRHEERMARINNTTYLDTGYRNNFGYDNYGNNFGYRNNFGFNRGYRNSFVNPNSLLSLGLLGCILWD